MWTYLQLSNTLAGLYFRINDIVALLKKAGFQPQEFILDGPSANVIWTLIITELEARDKVLPLVQAALLQYPDNQVLLDYQRLLQDGKRALRDKPVIRKSVYAGDTPAWKGSPVQVEKITGTQSTLLPVSFLETGTIKARAVARVLTPNGMGSGFLISAHNLFLTNNHVLENAAVAADSKFQFNYQLTRAGLPDTAIEFEADAATFQTSVTDDWSVVRLTGDAAKLFGYLELKEAKVDIDDFVNIIQHPGGEYKQIGLYHNLVTSANDDVIQYLTDTLPGSSGSPVFNSDWEVVALHHSGGWFEEPNTSTPVLRNEGININKIRQTLIKIGFSL